MVVKTKTRVSLATIIILCGLHMPQQVKAEGLAWPLTFCVTTLCGVLGWKALDAHVQQSKEATQKQILAEAALLSTTVPTTYKKELDAIAHYSTSQMPPLIAPHIFAYNESVETFIAKFNRDAEKFEKSLALLKTSIAAWKDIPEYEKIRREGEATFLDGKKKLDQIMKLKKALTEGERYLQLYAVVYSPTPMENLKNPFPLVQFAGELDQTCKSLAALINQVKHKQCSPEETALIKLAEEKLRELSAKRATLLTDPEYHKQNRLQLENERYQEHIAATKKLAEQKARLAEAKEEEVYALREANKLKAEEIRLFPERLTRAQARVKQLESEVEELKKRVAELEEEAKRGKIVAAQLADAKQELERLVKEIERLKRDADNPPQNPEAGSGAFEWLKMKISQLRGQW